MGLVALQHVGSSRTRAQTRVPLHWQVDSEPLPRQGSPNWEIFKTQEYTCIHFISHHSDDVITGQVASKEWKGGTHISIIVKIVWVPNHILRTIELKGCQRKIVFPIQVHAAPEFHLPTQVKKSHWGTSLAVQWLRLCASTAGGVGSIPGQGTKIPHASLPGQKIKKKTKTLLELYLFVPDVVEEES